KVALLSEPSVGQPLRFRIVWSPRSPVVLYPPCGIQFTVRTTDGSKRERRAEQRSWILQPSPKDYRVLAPSDSQSLAIRVTADGNVLLQRVWNLRRRDSVLGEEASRKELP